jgi:hypothetical protein
MGWGVVGIVLIVAILVGVVAITLVCAAYYIACLLLEALLFLFEGIVSKNNSKVEPN